MVWLVILLVAVVLTVSGAALRRRLTARRTRSLEESGNFRLSRRAAEEDVTQFGEELTELHFETLGTPLDDALRKDYQGALDSYEHSKQQLRDATRSEDITRVTRALDDGRFSMACVLTAQDGAKRPARRPPCFFNPVHGPSEADLEWAPPGGVLRDIPVCFRCSERLGAGDAPDVRTVRWGSRRVPWFQAGPGYGPYAEGYYGRYARDGVFPGFIMTSMLLVPAHDGGNKTGDWSGWDGSSWVDDGPGTFDWGGGHGTGHEWSGDFGGGDGGGDGGGGGGDGGG